MPEARRAVALLAATAAALAMAGCSDGSGSGYLTVDGHIGDAPTWGMSGSWPTSRATQMFQYEGPLCVSLGGRAMVTGVTVWQSPGIEVSGAALQVAARGTRDSAFYFGDDSDTTLDTPHRRGLPSAVDIACDHLDGNLDPASWVGLAVMLRRTSRSQADVDLKGLDIAYDIDGDHKVLHVPLKVRWCAAGECPSA